MTGLLEKLDKERQAEQAEAPKRSDEQKVADIAKMLQEMQNRMQGGEEEPNDPPAE